MRDIQQRLSGIELVIFDVDGVMTDGSLTIDSEGRESLRFSVQDGYGVFRGYSAGLEYAIITGRTSGAVEYRAANLMITRVYQGHTNKQHAFDEILAESGIDAERVAYMGDDLNDLPVMKQAGVSCAVANARREIKESADLVTEAQGGRGAVREFIEMIIAAKGGVPSS